MGDSSIRLGVVGGGRMGARIAGALAVKGAEVIIVDRTEFDRDRAKKILAADLASLVQQGLLTNRGVSEATARVQTMESMDDMCSQSQIVIESIFEDLDAKRQLFTKLDAACSKLPSEKRPVLTSNSMNFSINTICDGVVRNGTPYCGLRFLYPVYCIPLVEVSGTWNQTPPECERVHRIMETLGIRPFYHEVSHGRVRRKLFDQEIEDYYSRQRAAVRSEVQAEREQNSGGEKVSKKAEPEKECVICMEARADAIFAPCGHQDCCMECARHLITQSIGPGQAGVKVCPTCRSPIERLLVAAT